MKRITIRISMEDQEGALTFESYKAFHKAITPNRFDILHYISSNEATSIRGMQRGLNRDYRNVHSDTKALMDMGLIEDDKGLHLTFDVLTLPTLTRES